MTPPAKFPSNAPQKVEANAANHDMIAPPPAAGFRLVRYFTLTGLVAFLIVAAALLYFERREGDFFKQVQQERNAFFAQVQDSFAKRHDAAAHTDVLNVYEAGPMAHAGRPKVPIHWRPSAIVAPPGFLHDGRRSGD